MLYPVPEMTFGAAESICKHFDGTSRFTAKMCVGFLLKHLFKNINSADMNISLQICVSLWEALLEGSVTWQD